MKPKLPNMFRPLPAERFAAFHRTFQGDTWDICERCRGMCEIHKIGSLMPGEAEFIAGARGEPVEEFRRLYLDGIRTPFGVVDVLKMKPGCPFLSADFRCTIKDVKVVLCEVYPVVFAVEGDRVDFLLDDWCPITRLVPALAAQFEAKGIPAIRALDVPTDWYRAVETYDSLCVDYHRIHALRASNPGYVVFTLEQILGCQAEEDSPPVLHPPTRR